MDESGALPAGKREEGRGKREEGRGKREEGRGKREEGIRVRYPTCIDDSKEPWESICASVGLGLGLGLSGVTADMPLCTILCGLQVCIHDHIMYMEIPTYLEATSNVRASIFTLPVTSVLRMHTSICIAEL